MSAPPVADTTQHLRGSSLMLAGRLLTVLVNFGVQILTVRYFSKSDYGAFAYAVALVALATNITVFGLDKSVMRFLPLYQERGEDDKVRGTLLLMLGTILAVGLALVLLVLGLSGSLLTALIPDRTAVLLLLLLIALAPMDAIDSFFISLFAVFAPARAAFVPKFLLGPILQLLVVLLLLLLQGSVFFLAVGSLIAGIVATVVTGALLLRILRRQGVLSGLLRQPLTMPAREVFGFTVPLLVSDLVFVLRSSGIIALLGYFHAATDVAALRAVLPVAGLNLVVYQSFQFLFTPQATRLFARGDREALSDLYWQSAGWIAVLTFPVFVVTFALAGPLTVLFFGERYASSAPLMALLALGYYLNALPGFNGLALRVCGQVRYLFGMDAVAALASLGLSLLLIPRWGALGAAVATGGTLVLQNLLYQAGLRRGAGVPPFDMRYLPIYLRLASLTLALLLLQWLVAPPLPVGLAVAALASLLLIRWSRTELGVARTFPELLRFPLARQLVG